MATLYDFNSAARQITFEPPPSFRAHDCMAEFRQAMIRDGFDPPEIHPGGKLQRFGPKKECWLVYYDDGVPAGAYGSWKGDQTFKWCAKEELSMTAEEALQYRIRVDRMREARETELQKRHQDAATEARKVWEAALPAPPDHPYLVKKGVNPAEGVRLHSGCLLIPVMDASGRLHSYQTIAPSGEKRFLSGGAKAGNFFTIHGSERIAICEGYATAASLHQATGWTTVEAFDCGNLLPVAQAVREANPTGDIVQAADNDQWTEGNPGVAKAKEAADKIHAAVIVPAFSEISQARQATDWNDLHQLEGLDTVRKQATQTRKMTVNLLDWGLDKYQGPAPERRYLVDQTFPMGCCIVLAAMGGAGKGYLGLDLALKVASRQEEEFFPAKAFGGEIHSTGPVVIISAEDDKDEIHRRLRAIGRETVHPVYLVPLPDVHGPMPLVVPDRNGPQVTTAWRDLEEQILDIKPALVILDPLAAFAMVDINSDPAAGQFVQMLLASLAKRSGACVIVAHHMAKTKIVVNSPEDARALVRGTSAIVDGARGAYVLWPASDEETTRYCQMLDIEYERDRVWKGCLAKANYGADKSIKTFVRNSYGLLEVMDEKLQGLKATHYGAVKESILAEIAKAAKEGCHYSRSGSQSMYERRFELPSELQNVSRNDLYIIVNDYIKEGIVVLKKNSRSGKRSDLDVKGDGE